MGTIRCHLHDVLPLGDVSLAIASPECSVLVRWSLLGCVQGQAASTHRAHTDFGNPYSASGFETRLRWRVRSSGAQTASRSNNTASSGMSVGVGCGQSLPHTRRSGAAFT